MFILSSIINQNLYLSGSLKEFLRLFKCVTSRGIYLIVRRLDLLFKFFHQERGEFLTRFIRVLLGVVVLPLFIDIGYVIFL